MNGPLTSQATGSPPVAPAILLRQGLSVVPVRAVIHELDAAPRREHAVLVNVGPPYRLVETLADVTEQTRGAPGDVAVVPAGLTLATRSVDGSPQRVESLAFVLSPELLSEVLDAAGVGGRHHELLPVVGARSPQVAQLATLVQTTLPDRTGLGQLALESFGHALTVAVVREHSTARDSQRVERRPTGLSRTQLRRVLRHVEDNLAEPLTLGELAAVAHVSPFHFARLFRASIGSSPHQYVVRRRVLRARDLLLDTALPLSEVAAQSGFADQSHLTRHARRHLGATPAVLRAARASR